MKRILCVVTNMNTGGAETFLMKIYRQLDRSRYQMDFCICNQQQNVYEDEIRRLGGQIYHLPPKTKQPFSFLRQFWKVLRTQRYRYVLRLGSTIFEMPDLYVAWLAGAKVKIFRSCNASATYPSVLLRAHKALRRLVMRAADIQIAPSDLAAQFTFGSAKGVCLLPNGLDTRRFTFSDENRCQIRQELAVKDRLVVGHIGRFNVQKNHRFLLEIFAEIKKRRPEAVLWLVGKGELEKQVKEYAAALGILSSVQFLGVRLDIPALLCAMDVFVFPSLFEGMPNTVIEAQTSGLPCLISDTITRQARQTDRVHFASLSRTPAQWAEEALSLADTQAAGRTQAAEQMRVAGYDVASTAAQFTKLVFGEGHE